MYAVIATGGKQYRVSEGDKLRVEQLDVPEGGTVDFSEPLLVVDGERVAVGAPSVAGAKVTATVVAHGRGPKIRIIKFRRRKHYRKETGHRQNYTELMITGVTF